MKSRLRTLALLVVLTPRAGLAGYLKAEASEPVAASTAPTVGKARVVLWRFEDAHGLDSGRQRGGLRAGWARPKVAPPLKAPEKGRP